MKDIFISYSRKDAAIAKKFRTMFEAEGWSVFWDVDILPGKTWDQALQQKLEDCKCIVVLWSKNSVASDYVKEEASYGKNKNKLVPIIVDFNVSPPFGFQRIEAAMLKNWKGNKNDREYKNLITAIKYLAPIVKQKVASPPPPVSKNTPKKKTITPASSKSKSTPLIALALGLIAAIAIGIFMFNQSAAKSKPVTPTPVVEVDESKEIAALFADATSLMKRSNEAFKKELALVTEGKKEVIDENKKIQLRSKLESLTTKLKNYQELQNIQLNQLKDFDKEVQVMEGSLDQELALIFSAITKPNSQVMAIIDELFNRRLESKRKNARRELVKNHNNALVMVELIRRATIEYKASNKNGIYQVIEAFNLGSQANTSPLKEHKTALKTFFKLIHADAEYGTTTKLKMKKIERRVGV